MNHTSKKNAMPFLLLFAAFFLLHLWMPHIRDDRVIEEGMEFTSITPNYILYLIGSKYKEWSSRTLINVMTLIMGKLPHIIWIILDSGMAVLVAWSISCLTKEKEREEVQINWFIVALLFLYPFSHMATAGWKATTVTYWWALACGLYAMLPIQRWIFGEKIRGWEYPLFFLAALYGANQEQMSAVLAGIYGCSILVIFWMVWSGQGKGKKREVIFLGVIFFVCFAEFLLALFCPGNEARMGDETAIWFADYGRITWVQKLEMGISSAGYKLFYSGNLCFLVLTGIFFWLVWKKYQRQEYRIVAGIPFIMCLIMGPCYNLVSNSLEGLKKWKTGLTSYGTITVENYTEWSSYLPLIWIGIGIGCLMLTFYLVFGKSWKTFGLCVIFLIGYASRVVLGFSPTVWASSDRTYLFLYMAVIVVAVFGYQEGVRKKIWGVLEGWVFYVLAGVSFVSQIFAILG